jgi:hypothetical protein
VASFKLNFVPLKVVCLLRDLGELSPIIIGEPQIIESLAGGGGGEGPTVNAQTH